MKIIGALIETELPATWTGFTRFTLLNERPPNGHTSSGRETDEETNDLQTRHGMMIKLDVKNGVYTMGMWTCLDETGPVFSRQGR